MSALRARVEKRRLVLDEPTTLPEGTVVDLVADEVGECRALFFGARLMDTRQLLRVELLTNSSGCVVADLER